jgi:hypothetical protein
MNTRYAVVRVTLAVALVAALGCTYQTRGAATGARRTTTGATAAQAQGPAAPSAERAKQHPDPAAALLGAAGQLSLSGIQSTTVHTLKQQLHDSWQNVDAAFRAMRDHLAAQVRTGVIDPAQVQADESFAASTLAAYQAQEIFALNSLHAVLGPEQRVAIATAVRAEQPGRAEEQARPEAEEGTTARLDRLTRDLALDAAQQQRVAGLLAAQPARVEAYHAEYRRRVDAVLNAFPTETFDARTTAQTAGSPAAMVHEHVQRKVAFLAELLPILRPDQRDKLASSIEAREWGHGRSGGG